MLPDSNAVGLAEPSQCWTLQFLPGYPLALPQPGKTQSPVKVILNNRRPSKLALGYLRPEVSCKVFAQISINLFPLIFKFMTNHCSHIAK